MTKSPKRAETPEGAAISTSANRRPDLWESPAIAGFAFRVAEMTGADAARLIGGDGRLTPLRNLENAEDIQALARRVRSLWPEAIGLDAVSPLKSPAHVTARLADDLRRAGADLTDESELVVSFETGAPRVEARSLRAAIVLEGATAVADGWRVRRCSWCGGLFPAQRETRGAPGFCSSRCRGAAFRAGK